MVLALYVAMWGRVIITYRLLVDCFTDFNEISDGIRYTWQMLYHVWYVYILFSRCLNVYLALIHDFVGGIRGLGEDLLIHYSIFI